MPDDDRKKRWKKPLGVSKLQDEAKRRSGTTPVYEGKYMAMITGLPIFDDVITRIRQGYNATDTAKYIQKLGFLEEHEMHTVRKAINWYVKKHMKPADLASVRLSAIVKDAASKVKEGMDELEILQSATKSKMQLVQTFQRLIATIMKEDDELTRGPEERDEAIQRFMLLGGTTAMLRALEQIRKTVVSYAEVKDLIGLSSGDPESAMTEINAKVSSYARMAFPGDERTHKAFTNPESRRKLLGILRKVAKQRPLYEEENPDE